ncbi:MAG: hypothetical protein Q8R02_10980 [Hyphomonadaceae bacterium]|nr:hypothetical protein [Hyphomonadaceae bacterium]
MPIPDPYPLVVRDIIIQALAHSPELMTADMGGNRRAALTADIAERIASELAANGFLPPDARLEEGIVFQTVDYVVRRIPEATLRNRKLSWYTREDWLASPGCAVSRHIIHGLEERGFRITKSFVSTKSHGSTFPGHNT